jgi:hypothetical protein
MSDDSRHRGRVLKVSRRNTGMSQVVLDNGPFRTITLHCHTETLGDLLDAGSKELWTHLMVRGSDRFRKKEGPDGTRAKAARNASGV